MMTLLSSGCATAPDETITCPGLVSYSKAQEMEWAQEVAASSPGSMIRTETDDYLSLRDQVRACQKR